MLLPNLIASGEVHLSGYRSHVGGILGKAQTGGMSWASPV